MAEVIRCPYCVADDNFRALLANPKGYLVCTKCGHLAKPRDPDFKCFCQKCQAVRVPASSGSSKVS